MSSLSWNMPWLLLIAVQPVILLLLRKYVETKHLNNYVKKELQPWVVIRNSNRLSNGASIRNITYYLAWVLFAIAAAGPRFADETYTNNSHRNDIMIVLDISQSMHATDLVPNRLRQAHKKINQLVNTATDSRIGIITYAAKPHLYVPLTYDKKALRFYIKNLSFLTPPSQGSKPLSALKLAKQYIKENAINKSILLITDADTDLVENDLLKEATTDFLENNVTVHTLLMATNNGEAVPAFNDGWITVDGRPVISRPRPENYQYLSNKTGGLFRTSATDNTAINSIIEQIKTDSTLSANETTEKNWRELFYLFLIPAILFLFLNMFPYYLPQKKLFLRKTNHVNVMIVTISLIVLSTISTTGFASQSDALRAAYTTLMKKQYVKSRELYSAIDGFDARFGEAISSYRLSDHPRAIRLFEQAVLLAESPEDFTKTLYNLGNSYFQTGNYALAISNFNSALLYTPSHQPSLMNKAFAEKALLATEERKKLLAITSRAGRGPRSARADNDVSFSENNNISLDNSELNDLVSNNSNTNKEVDIPEFIILRGLEFANQTAVNKKKIKDTAYNSALNNRSLSKLNKLLDNQVLLWRRIFEIEEGYPAPLDEPDVLPGVPAW